MAMVFLTFNEEILKEIPLVQPQMWIGRRPHNSIVIDNPAVSGEHARIILEEGGYSIEDMASTNGTFVNDKRVDRHPLQDGDRIRIGKHVLVYADGEVAPDQPSASLPHPFAFDPKKTMILDTAKQRELLRGERKDRGPAQAPEKVGVLQVVAGKTDRKDYQLVGRLAIIGSQDAATVRLTRWFAPKVAALISRRPEGYVIGMSEARIPIRVNGTEIQDRGLLKNGDLIEVAGVTMQFSLLDHLHRDQN